MSETSAPKGLEAKLKRIADAVRAKTETEELMNIDDMIDALSALNVKTSKKGGGGQ